MDEEATQPATQIVIDPRRLGQCNSGMNDEDLADICCILHPASIPAYKAAAEIHRANPHHTISSDSNVKIRENKGGLSHQDVDENELDAEGLISCDIVLRLSADLKDPLGGFHFGRNRQRCDFVIGHNSEFRRISNVHFKIYINEYGTIMLEDQSTNGTAIDGTLLRGKDKEKGRDYKHTLESGSTIVLTMTPPETDYRFHVRIPQRDREAENAYQENLRAFFLRRDQTRMENEARVAAAGTKEPVNLFPAAGTPTPNPTSVPSMGKSVREWKGGQKYNRVSCIGRGAFANVYKITDKFDGVPYAAKELEKRKFMKNGVLDLKVEMEMNIMSRIKHPNVVQYIEHVDFEEHLYIIMEYIPGGDLGALISCEGFLPESDVRVMGNQLLSALSYLHEMNITHRDVKPDNILVSSRAPFHVKLTDFGLSKMVETDETFLRTFCGTLLYCAPEVYSEYREYDIFGRRNPRGVDKRSLPPQRYDHAVDVWSLAGVLFYALCGSPPFPAEKGTGHQELLHKIMTQALDIRPLQRTNVTDSGIRFVRRMLHVRPEHRATIAELEQSSWLTGKGDSVELSMEDEVDMIVDGNSSPSLAQGTSQLSIQQPDEAPFADSDVFGKENIPPSVRTATRQIEIPSSFSTGDSRSNGASSFGFDPVTIRNGNRNDAHLFGEVPFALGSSGAIPSDQLDLLLPAATRGTHPAFESQEFIDTPAERKPTSNHSQIGQNQIKSPAADVPAIMAPPVLPHAAIAALKAQEVLPRGTSSSSLMGAESMVGHLNMHSPAGSPNPDSPAPAADFAQDPAVSHRRGRDEFEDLQSDVTWQPMDLPTKRRRTSEREIDIELPASVFWDPRDKSTHHFNYPRMSNKDFETYQEYAALRGELFAPGHKTFETTMHSFRSSRSPSIEPDVAKRANSEPTKEEGRRLLMKRDERQLAASADKLGSADGSNNQPSSVSKYHSNVDSAESTTDATNSPQNDVHPVVGNDFQPPKRILGKVIASPDSCLPTITLNITDPITSWGRGHNTTVRYTNGNEIRIPKYAFKIFLFKPGFYDGKHSPSQAIRTWAEKDQDMTFYISSKASLGIWINDTKLCSHDRQNPSTESKHWGELRHGDHLTVWYNDQKRDEYTRFRFECFWGKSREPRQPGDDFKTLEQGPLLEEIEKACLSEENAMLREKIIREEEERKSLEELWAREKWALSNPVNFTQSVPSTPNAVHSAIATPSQG